MDAESNGKRYFMKKVERMDGGVAAQGTIREWSLTSSKEWLCMFITLDDVSKNPLPVYHILYIKTRGSVYANRKILPFSPFTRQKPLSKSPSLSLSLYMYIYLYIVKSIRVWIRQTIRPIGQAQIDGNGRPPTRLSLLPNWGRTRLFLPPNEAPGKAATGAQSGHLGRRHLRARAMASPELVILSNSICSQSLCFYI